MRPLFPSDKMRADLRDNGGVNVVGNGIRAIERVIEGKS